MGDATYKYIIKLIFYLNPIKNFRKEMTILARIKVFDKTTQTWVYADKSFGKNGKSAYDYAKDGGFTGTEAEFAEKLASSGSTQDAVTYTEQNLTELQKEQARINIDASAKSEGVFYIEGSGTTDSTNKTSTWTGSSTRITEYYDGLTIKYKIGEVGQSTVTLNINNLGAKTVYRFGTTKLTTQFPVGSILHLTYHADLNDGCWVTNDYDANTNTYQRVYATTSNVEYPITARYATTTGASYYAEYGRYSTDVTLNPSTKTITATAFKGKLIGNADTATKATQDTNGNVIADTYETKVNVANKIDKSGITLGVHTDGLVYIFIDGAPVGNGIELTSSGDVTGYVDFDNNIILTGNLTNGTYTLKYTTTNGQTINIGDFTLGSNLADPTSADWLTDKRLAMAYGYTKDSVGSIFTNYIPVKQGDVLRVKGLNLYGVQNGVSSAIACYSSKTDTSTDSDGVLNAYKGGVYTSVDTELEENGVRDQVRQDGNIFAYTVLLYNDGTQMFDPETLYIRISAPLLEGYTAEEVIITVNEEIPKDDTYWFITNNLTNC